MSNTQRMMVKVVGSWAGVENPNSKSSISFLTINCFSVEDRLVRSRKMSLRGWWSRIWEDFRALYMWVKIRDRSLVSEARVIGKGFLDLNGS